MALLRNFFKTRNIAISVLFICKFRLKANFLAKEVAASLPLEVLFARELKLLLFLDQLDLLFHFPVVDSGLNVCVVFLVVL